MDIMNKIIVFLIGLIVFALAGEGGYILGIKAGKKIGVRETLKVQKPKDQESVLIQPSFGKEITELSGMIKNLPKNSIWKSEWTMIIGGKLISYSNDSITLKTSSGEKTIGLTIPFSEAKIFVSHKNASEVGPTNATKEELQPENNISIQMTFDLLNSKTKSVEVFKIID